MSAVYLARHVVIDRLAAVKVLRRDLAADPAHRTRFLREARAVNRIQHENIVDVTDYGETSDGVLYLVMEYLPGESLLAASAAARCPCCARWTSRGRSPRASAAPTRCAWSTGTSSPTT
jgi:serine/threonine protein kinase